MDPMTRAMFGQHAIHIPINIIVQRTDDEKEGRIIGVFQTSSGEPLLFGSKKTHQLIMGDCVIRPHLVAESDAFIGHGISGIMRSGWTDIEGWIGNKGGVILNPLGKAFG